MPTGRYRRPVDPEGLLRTQVARAMRVCLRTAAKVIDTQLPCRRETRGRQRGVRRVRAADLRRLMEEHGVPTDALDRMLEKR